MRIAPTVNATEVVVCRKPGLSIVFASIAKQSCDVVQPASKRLTRRCGGRRQVNTLMPEPDARTKKVT